ncbi:MAG: cell division protein FtsQ/DivIB [Thermoflavifilum sp.]|nr:cell division protein FtsQ/DivIB [Thermoflavifilum sp.]
MPHEQKTYRVPIVSLIAGLMLMALLIGLLVMAAHQSRQQVCVDVVVEPISSIKQGNFLSAAEIEHSVEAFHPKGKYLQEINLSGIEQDLLQNPWLAKVELFFDTRGRLHVRYAQKRPVLQVFTRTGNSFYLDVEGHAIPLSDWYHPDVPVVTGWPDKSLQPRDSLLLTRVMSIGHWLMNNSFWNAQVQQLHIQDDGSLLMLPTVGPVIQLGDGQRFDLQCRVLEAFYQQVLLKGYLTIYDTVDVSVPTQIMAIRKPSAIQLQPVRWANQGGNDTRLSIASDLNAENIHHQKPFIP